jgi:KaiC/GvpD/RAD55 family RecA-like ATPase
VSGYVVRGHTTLFCAEPKAGKTTFLMDLARAIATGRPTFCGRAVKPGRIFWVDPEMGADLVIDWATRRGLETAESFRAWSGHRSAIEDGTLRAAITEAKADVLIVDSWSKWVMDALGDAGEGNNPTLVREMEYINRAGRNLSADRKRTLTQAKVELRKLFHR